MGSAVFVTMEIRALLKRPLVTVEKDVSIRDAAKKMEKEDVGFLVIVDEKGQIYGVISERDIARLLAEGADPDRTKVGDVARKDIVKIHYRDPVSKAAYLMRKHKIRHLVVTDDEGKPIGVVSIRDIVDLEIALENLSKISELSEEEEEQTYTSPIKVTT